MFTALKALQWGFKRERKDMVFVLRSLYELRERCMSTVKEYEKKWDKGNC